MGLGGVPSPPDSFPAPPPPRFIRIGGYKLLNTWLTGSKATNNVPFLQQLLLTLQHLPLTVDHLKQVCGGAGVTGGVSGCHQGGVGVSPGGLWSPWAGFCGPPGGL